ncbi:uncharacterized protein LOC120273840 [Dioscorea cayenensis subsp. rotundata]|uniref:RING-type E3 ubiquitin transferase n=1 Tax=Dioscorea cayennensis subsp. rotundata TaxID=55577 RepID=A0AB40C9I1_DIOCR|nr:uncharacterized protein LOC120273840 [Dioscorea cayenensis subsp. rotundata]XP_039136495.1 uncharacterized protein LOC120273840 [Dioscorea cayenensis subsp. rotundata]
MPPSFNVPVNGVNTNNGQRSNDYIRATFSKECPNYMAASATSHEPFHTSSSLGYSSQLPPNYGQKGFSYYNVPPIGGNSIAIQMHNPTGGYKRKQMAMPMMFDEGSTSGSHRGGRSLIPSNYKGRSSLCTNRSRNRTSLEFNNYTGGSFFNFSAPEHHLLENYVLPPQIQIAPWDPLKRGPGCRNVLPVGTRSQRNVRSRDCYAGPYPLSAPSYNPYPPWHFFVAGSIEQSRQPVIPMGPSRMMFSAGTNISNGVSEMPSLNQSNPTRTRNPSAFFPIHFAPPTRVSRADVNSRRHRVSSHISNQSYPTIRSVATMGSTPPFWNARPVPLPLPIEDRRNRNNLRNNEMRTTCPSVEHSAPFQNSWISQGIIMNNLDDILGFLDPHRDMRLDIDNMSYEELLTLEERIGNVSTGLSKRKLSGCLKVRKYRSSCRFQDRQDKKCAICLEEYEDRKKLGRLNCRHEFHLNCIKTWLQKKDICPICKTSAMTTTSKEKQKNSS